MAIRLWARVDAAEAVRAGSARSGVLSLDLGDEDLARLTPEQREELARLPGLGSQEQPGGSDSPATIPGGRLEPGVLAGWLDGRRARFAARQIAADRIAREWLDSDGGQRAPVALARGNLCGVRGDLSPDLLQQVEQREARDQSLRDAESQAEESAARAAAETAARRWLSSEPDGWNPPEAVERAWSRRLISPELLQQVEQREDRRTAIIEERRAAEKQAAEDAARAHAAAVAELVRQLGTESQALRIQEGLLPEAEAEALVRDHVLAGLADFPRFERLTGDDLEHTEGCYSQGSGGIEWSGEPAGELPELPFEQFRELRQAAGAAVVVSPRIHRGRCGECEAEAVRYSARAVATWHGREYSREYALS